MPASTRRSIASGVPSPVSAVAVEEQEQRARRAGRRVARRQVFVVADRRVGRADRPFRQVLRRITDPGERCHGLAQVDIEHRMWPMELVSEEVELARPEVERVAPGEVPAVAGDDLARRVLEDERLTILVERELVQRTAQRLGLDVLEDPVPRDRERPAVRRRPRLPPRVVVREEDVAVDPSVRADMDEVCLDANDLHRVAAVPRGELIWVLEDPFAFPNGRARRPGRQRHRDHDRSSETEPAPRARRPADQRIPDGHVGDLLSAGLDGPLPMTGLVIGVDAEHSGGLSLRRLA